MGRGGVQSENVIGVRSVRSKAAKPQLMGLSLSQDFPKNVPAFFVAAKVAKVATDANHGTGAVRYDGWAIRWSCIVVRHQQKERCTMTWLGS